MLQYCLPYYRQLYTQLPSFAMCPRTHETQRPVMCVTNWRLNPLSGGDGRFIGAVGAWDDGGGVCFHSLLGRGGDAELAVLH